MEMKIESVICNRCSRFGGISITERAGLGTLIPRSWEYQTSSGWGMYDSTRTELLCDSCLLKDKERDG